MQCLKIKQVPIRWEMSQKVSFSKGYDIVFNLLESYSRNIKLDQKCQTAYPRNLGFLKKILKTFFYSRKFDSYH